MFKYFLFIAIPALLIINTLYANDKHFIIVAKDGSGDFKTINEAVQSLPMFNYERVVIFIKSGVYQEKVKINRDFVTLRGENRQYTILKYSQLRSDWEAHKDSIGPAVLNIYGDDFIIENMTVKNLQPQVGPHAFAVYGEGTRTIVFNCAVVSNGGDTISLWNYKNGMYYHSQCSFIGAVDFVCPRGWCYITDTRFYELKKTASVWHAGGYDKKQKLVINNSYIDGVEGFHLGRHHYDAQFYLMNCTFSDRLKDTAIYRVSYNDITKDRAFNWGPRYYFFNCKREGRDYDWYKDNLNTAEGNLKPENITCEWTFDGKWNPESVKGPEITKYEIKKNILQLEFNEMLTVEGLPELKSKSGKEFKFAGGNGSVCLSFLFEGALTKEDLSGLSIVNNSKITGTIATLMERNVDLRITP